MRFSFYLILAKIVFCALICAIVNFQRYALLFQVTFKAGSLVGNSNGLVIERLRVRIPAGAAGKFSSSESTLCADFYSVSVPPEWYRSGT